MSLVNKFLSTAAKQYRSILSSRLAAVGLKYDDLLVEKPDTIKGLERIDPESVIARERRIKRAFDASAKRKNVYADKYDVYDPYLREARDLAQAEREEREILNGY